MKNIVAFDLETTGLNKSKDQIIQIGMVKFNPETFEVVDTYNQYVQPVGNYTISLAAYFKHGIKPDFLAKYPHFKEVAPKVIEFIGDCDVLTYNGNSFDISFLKEELTRVGMDINFMARKCYDAFLEEKRRNGNTLEETFKRYTGKTMLEFGYEAHDALSDVKATIEVYKAQSKTAPVEAEQMFGEDGVIKIMKFRDEDVPCFSLGKYRQISVEFVSSIDQNYLKWCVNDSNFAPSTKEYISQFIKN